METERDKGYAWVVLFAALMNHILWAGLFTAASIYILDWIEVFEGGIMALGMVGGTLNGLNYFSGLFTGPLVDRFDCRVVSFAGTLLVVIGLLISSQTTSTVWLYICYGVLAGFGCGWTVVPPILMVQYYFDKHRPCAAGFSLMGQGLGTFILMPLLQLLIQYYGWRGAMIIHAGIELQILVVSSLYRPFDLSQIQENRNEIVNGTKTYRKNQHKEDKPSNKILNTTDRPNAKNSSTEGNSRTTHESDTSTKEDTLQESKKEFEQNETDYNNCIRFCRNTWDLSLFKMPVYIQYTLALVLIQYPSILFYRFISLKAHVDGISKMESSLLPSIAGLLSTLTRLCTSCVVNFKCSNRLLLCGVGALGQGVVVMLTTLSWDFYSYAACASLFGLFTGLHFTLTTTVMADLMGVVRLAHANSFLSMFSGLAVLSSLPIAGAIIDSTGNFNTPFIIYGVIGCTAGTLIFLVPITQKYTDKSHQTDMGPPHEELTKKTIGNSALKMFMSTDSIHSIT